MKKKLISLILATALVVPGCAGGGKITNVEDLDVKKYEDNKKIVMMADLPPSPDEYNMKLYKEAGFNTYIMTEDWTPIKNGNSTDYFAAVEYVGSQGLDVFIRGYDGSSCPGYFEEKFSGKNFLDYEPIKGIYLIDEPTANKFDDIKNVYVPWYNENYSQDLYWHLNLLPSYSSTFGLTAEEMASGEPVYEIYMNKYVEEILKNVQGAKDISLDHYPLRTGREGNYLSNMWLYDLMIAGQIAKAQNCDFNVCIQSFDGGYRLPESATDIKFQMYTSMAFGANMFEFFCYCSNTALKFNALLTNLQPTDLYYYVKEAIAEIASFDHVFLSFDWQGTMAINGKNNATSNSAFDVITDKTLKEASGIKSVSALEDCLIGSFKDADGNDGYLIVNYGEPTEGKKNTVSLEFEKAAGVAVYRYGIETVYGIASNKTDLELDAGEGVFLIPLSEKE